MVPAPLYLVFAGQHMSPPKVYVVCYICHPNAVTHIGRASAEGGKGKEGGHGQVEIWPSKRGASSPAPITWYSDRIKG